MLSRVLMTTFLERLSRRPSHLTKKGCHCPGDLCGLYREQGMARPVNFNEFNSIWSLSFQRTAVFRRGRSILQSLNHQYRHMAASTPPIINRGRSESGELHFHCRYVPAAAPDGWIIARSKKRHAHGL